MPTQTTGTWLATYKNAAGEELIIPLIQHGSGFALETEKGQLQPYATNLQDAKLGPLQHVRTQKIEEPVPLPSSPELDAARAELNEKVARFPAEHVKDFLSRQTALKKAIDRRDNYSSASLDALQRWSTAIDAELTRVESARKAAIPPPIFERFDLTRNFRGKYFEDLFIDSFYEAGSPENGWNAKWLCRCSKCEAFGPAPRLVTAQTLLELEAKFRAAYSRQKPCKG